MVKFSGSTLLIAINFGHVIWTLRPLGSGPDPENGLFLSGFWASWSCHTSWETGGQGKQNIGSGILIFCPRPEKMGPEGGAGQGSDQNFGISTFLIKGTPLKSGACHSLSYATF